MATNKWDAELDYRDGKMSAANVTVDMYNKGDGSTVEEIADFLGEEYHGSKSKTRSVIAKLTSLGVYKKPETPVKAEKVATIRKEDLVKNIETKIQETVEDFSLVTITRANISDLIKLAEFVEADIPDPR